MAIFYILCGVLIILLNLNKTPDAFVQIFQGAFGLKAAAGGALGAMMVAMQKGIARGIFSNEAGIGSAPIAAAAAKVDEPVKQGLVSMLGTVIDTLMICTMTGLAIIVTGAFKVEGLEGANVTSYAFQKGLPFPTQFSAFLLMCCLVFFAFTTILGWNYYSEKCLEYLTGENTKAVRVYRWLYIFCVFIGPYMTVSAVWTIADIVNGLMAIPNLIALIALNGVVVADTKAYFNKLKANKTDNLGAKVSEFNKELSKDDSVAS
jgi:AGCS family alanine or glycine:cation symporter